MGDAPLLILRTGSVADFAPEIAARHGDLDTMFVTACGVEADAVRIVKVDDGEALPDPAECSGAIITGSPCMVTEWTDWMETMRQWMPRAQAAGLPVLGVCFGHQFLAHIFGGEVGPMPGGGEVGTVPVRFNGAQEAHPLFADFAGSAVADMQVHHYQTVLRLPETAQLLADNDDERHHAAYYAPRVYGIQFHPEITGGFMAEMLAFERDKLMAKGFEVDRLLDEVRPSPLGEALLQRFAQMCRANAF